MLKGKKTRIIAVTLTATLTLGLTVFAKQATETISVIYDNIKILIDGVEYTAKDANGEVVEPFIYNGTTYLPVRGIANAFDVDVNWNDNRQVVELGNNKFELLGNMSLYNYENNNSKCTYTMNDEQTAMRFSFNIGNSDFQEKELATQTATYKLSNKYKTLFATLRCGGLEQTAMNIVIYGDNHKVLYTSYFIDDSISGIDLEVDVSGNEYLYIEANASFLSRCMGYIQLNNARLALD